MGSNSIKLNSNLESPNVMNRRLSSPSRRTSYYQNELQDESELRNQTVKITSIQQPELINQEDIQTPRESEQSTSVKQDAVPLRKSSNAKQKENIIKLAKNDITFARQIGEFTSKT